MNLPKFTPRYAAAIVLAIFAFFVFVLALKGTIVIPEEIVIGPLSFRLYSLTALTGILVSAFLINKELKKHKEFKQVQIDEALFWVVIPGIILARVWYVLIFWDFYSLDPLRSFSIWEGGLSIFGALVGGALGLAMYARSRKLNFPKLLELGIMFVPIGQIFGRFGNFINQELYGPETSLPWGTYIQETGKFHHPAFLYEQIGNALLFVFLYRLYKRKGLEGNGRIVAWYLVGYGIVRFTIDIFRNDRRVLWEFTIAQLIVLGFIAVGAAYLSWIQLKTKNAD